MVYPYEFNIGTEKTVDHLFLLSFLWFALSDRTMRCFHLQGGVESLSDSDGDKLSCYCSAVQRH